MKKIISPRKSTLSGNENNNLMLWQFSTFYRKSEKWTSMLVILSPKRFQSLHRNVSMFLILLFFAKNYSSAKYLGTVVMTLQIPVYF